MSHGLVHADAIDIALPRSKTLLWLWSLYPVLIPFYFMGRTLNPGTHKFVSGVPQVADYYFAAFMGLVFFSLPFRLPRASLPVVGAVVGFVAYTGLVNAVWATNLDDLSPLKNTLFYIYDALLFVTCLMLYERFGEQFLKTTVYAVMASVLLQAVLSPLAYQSEMYRQALFFNDENQLGYFCVLSATIVVLGTRRFAIPASHQTVFFAALGYLALLSQCRAALLALGVLVFVAVLERPLRLLMVLAGLGTIYFLLTLDPAVLGKSEERLVMSGEYDTLATRGYDRILNYPEHIVFGAGEGAYERFRSALFASEIHSSYGTLLFCYGLLGTTLFSAALFWIAKADWRTAFFLIPPFVYGSAHHGVRAAFFWTMLAVLCCIAALYPPPKSCTASRAAGPAPHLRSSARLPATECLQPIVNIRIQTLVDAGRPAPRLRCLTH